ncbi:MAG: phage tail protein [Bacteroidia bacterium]|nr:phage tail protein [Bacteroidia bacterium]
MTTIGLITEGPTDQVVIENILTGYFNNYDILFQELQPLRDETNRVSEIGGWTKVLEYCKSGRLKAALLYVDFVVIQIDTDVSELKGFDVPWKENGVDLSPIDLVERVKEKLIGLIGMDFYQDYQDKFLFAICVHQIECWFLPLFYSDNKREKISGCLNTLNRQIGKTMGFTIDQLNKNQKYYQEISKMFWKPKILKKCYPYNPSFAYFIHSVEEKQGIIPED